MPHCAGRAGPNACRNLWRRFNSRPIGVFTMSVSDNNIDLTYLLQWDSLADWEKTWGAFVPDKE
ncbi:MAG: NIPSNAP family protein [Betaproteobacteria bacterium]|jgi:hypothetical protein|nr:MAG: NIPSNAP family protein [Betaproteobacteria bacterium]